MKQDVDASRLQGFVSPKPVTIPGWEYRLLWWSVYFSAFTYAIKKIDVIFMGGPT